MASVTGMASFETLPILTRKLGFLLKELSNLQLPPTFIAQIAQPIQSQLTDFRSYEGQDMYAWRETSPNKGLITTFKAILRNSPETFAEKWKLKTQMLDCVKIAIQSVTSATEIRLSKKGRRAFEYTSASKAPGISLGLVKYFEPKNSVVRTMKRKDWDMFDPIVNVLSSKEEDAVQAREERNAW